jgi:GTP pyrophosphokinase
MYQSLHTTVTDDAGRTVDIQIRTPSMHRLAETGIVARPVGPGADGARLEGLSWLHSLLDWQEDPLDSDEFLESLSSDLDSDEVLAFTPKGRMIALPARSSPVDVAYAVHTDVGHRAIGARVNGRLVPLHTRLRNGDVVEILTSNLSGAGPSEDWLQFVKTSRARVRIRRRLARARRDAAAAAAAPTADEDEAARNPAALPPAPPTRQFARRGVPSLAGVADDGVGGQLPVRLARCCLPLPGDEVIGFTTHGSVVSLHRQECANAAEAPADRERIPVVAWSAPRVQIFPAEIAVEAFDRYGLLADITEVLSDTSASVRAASTTTSDDRVAHARFTIEVTGPAQLDKVLTAVRGVGGVYDCYRTCELAAQPLRGGPADPARPGPAAAGLASDPTRGAD